jgi:hypothetical protein
MKEPLGRRNDGIGPKPDEPHAFAVVRVKAHVSRVATMHLHREADDLQQQHDQQHDEVSIAFEQCFHQWTVNSE